MCACWFQFPFVPLNWGIGFCGCGLIKPFGVLADCIIDAGSENINVRSVSVSSHNEFSRDSKPELFDDALDMIGCISLTAAWCSALTLFTWCGIFFCGDVLFQKPPANHDDDDDWFIEWSDSFELKRDGVRTDLRWRRMSPNASDEPKTWPDGLFMLNCLLPNPLIFMRVIPFSKSFGMSYNEFCDGERKLSTPFVNVLFIEGNDMRLEHCLSGKYSVWLNGVCGEFIRLYAKSMWLPPWKLRSWTNDAFIAGGCFRDAIDWVEAAYDRWGNKLCEYSDGESDESVELCNLVSFHERLPNDETFDRSDVFSSLSTSLSSDASESISESIRWKLVFCLLFDSNCFFGKMTKLTSDSIIDVHATVNCKYKIEFEEIFYGKSTEKDLRVSNPTKEFVLYLRCCELQSA